MTSREFSKPEFSLFPTRASARKWCNQNLLGPWDLRKLPNGQWRVDYRLIDLSPWRHEVYQ